MGFLRVGTSKFGIIAYPPAFVNTKMQNKKALLKNNRAETSILSVEAAASAENTYLCPIPQTNGNISQAVHL